MELNHETFFEDAAPPSVAICAIVRDEAVYLPEWITFHHRMGICAFMIYDNGSQDATRAVLADLSQTFPLVFKSWRNRLSWIATQRSAYMDAVSTLRGRADFVLFIDVDEFVFSPDGLAIPETLRRFPRDIAAIGINQRVFGSSGLLTYDERPVTHRFVWRAQDNHEENLWIKSLVRLDCLSGMESSHIFTLNSGRYIHADGSSLVKSKHHLGSTEYMCSSTLVLNHYLLKSKQEFEAKKRRWRSTSIEARYVDDYFEKREKYANLVYDDSLSFHPLLSDVR